MVLIDETQAECAREHGCPPGRVCPLKAYFTETSGMASDDLHIAGAWQTVGLSRVNHLLTYF